MNIELICKTALEINNSWIYYSYITDIMTFIFISSFLFVVYKIVSQMLKQIETK